MVEKVWVSDEGLECLVTHYRTHRCGYVGVSAKHPLFGKDYSESPECLKRLWEDVKTGPVGGRGIISILLNSKNVPRIDCVFDVHGSITFSGTGHWEGTNPDLWFFGFDCAHYGDEFEDWTVDRVVSECEKLATQLAKVWCDA